MTLALLTGVPATLNASAMVIISPACGLLSGQSIAGIRPDAVTIGNGVSDKTAVGVYRHAANIVAIDIFGAGGQCHHDLTVIADDVSHAADIGTEDHQRCDNHGFYAQSVCGADGIAGKYGIAFAVQNFCAIGINAADLQGRGVLTGGHRVLKHQLPAPGTTDIALAVPLSLSISCGAPDLMMTASLKATVSISCSPRVATSLPLPLPGPLTISDNPVGVVLQTPSASVFGYRHGAD